MKLVTFLGVLRMREPAKALDPITALNEQNIEMAPVDVGNKKLLVTKDVNGTDNKLWVDKDDPRTFEQNGKIKPISALSTGASYQYPANTGPYYYAIQGDYYTQRAPREQSFAGAAARVIDFEFINVVAAKEKLHKDKMYTSVSVKIG